MSAGASPAGAPVVVLDDDPTGAQMLAGVRVLLSWDEARIAAALAGRAAVHLITNSRALAPDRAEALVREAAATAVRAVPGALVILRGDSTLRGHLLEEYAGLRDAVFPNMEPVLLLAPALPSAGRVTIGGVQLVDRGGARTPLHDTEYARDGVFAYRSARLVEWADERSGGLFPAAAGREVPLAELRRRGGAAVTEPLTELAAAGRPAVLAPDAETPEDLHAVATGYAAAVRAGVPVLVRCAPAFAGVLSGTTSPGLVAAPHTAGGVLVVCGSYVPTTSRQLAALVLEHPGALVEVDVVALASDDPAGEVSRAARAASERLRADGVAVVATPRERPEGTTHLEAGERIARNLARVLRRLEPRPSVVVGKGGITSAVTVREGLGADEAEVVGPVLPGVSHWRVAGPDGAVDCLVVPGNVGDDDLLARLVSLVMEG